MLFSKLEFLVTHLATHLPYPRVLSNQNWTKV